MEVNREFFRKLYTPDMWLSNLNNLRDKHKVYLGDPDRVWENDCYCIDYVNGAKLDCSTPWKNVSTVYLPIFMNDHWVLGVVDILGDMIPLVLQKIAYHETHPGCSEVISKILWPIVRVCDIPQQKSGGDCGIFLLWYLEVLAHGLDVNSYCQQDHVTQF